MDIFYLSLKHNSSIIDIKQKLERNLSEYVSGSGYEKDVMTNYKTFLDFQISRKLNHKSVMKLLAFKMKENLEKHGSIQNSETADLKSNMKISEFQFEWVKFNVVSKLLMWNKVLEFYIHTVSCNSYLCNIMLYDECFFSESFH